MSLFGWQRVETEVTESGRIEVYTRDCMGPCRSPLSLKGKEQARELIEQLRAIVGMSDEDAEMEVRA